jgi:hypothetical protein
MGMKGKHLLLGLLLAAVVCLALAGPVSAAQFTDTAGPYQASIENLAGWKIVGGYADGTFKPDNLLMRQQFAKMAVLAMGYEVTAADVSTFSDTPAADPANPLYPGSYVAVAAAKGMITGYTNGAFGFYDNVTRRQVITVVVRAAGAALEEPPAGWRGQLDYSDPVHGQNIRKAEYNGLLAGIADLLSWDLAQKATRGETAYLLNQLFTKTSAIETGASGAVKVSGKVTNQAGITVGRLEALGPVTLTLEHPKNGPGEYTGVRFSTLLPLWDVADDATTLDAVASDGYKVTIKLSDLTGSPDAMIAIDAGKLNLAMPGLASKTWVKDIVSLTFN